MSSGGRGGTTKSAVRRDYGSINGDYGRVGSMKNKPVDSIKRTLVKD